MERTAFHVEQCDFVRYLTAERVIGPSQFDRRIEAIR